MPSAAASRSPTDADDAYYRAVLHELIDMGMGLARVAHGQAMTGGEDPAGARDAAEAFERVSRAVRRTVALARRVAEPPPERAEAGSGRRRAAARRRIIREVEDAIQREAGGVEAEALYAELRERLDAPELEDEIDDRPVAEVIADICRDLGLGRLLGNRPWKRRTPADVAALCARAAQPCAAPPPVAERSPPARPAPAHAGPPSSPRDAGADLLRFTFPARGT